ncbi:MAG: HEAT repeat domain-containing protein [Candidatus Poseidoniia archaeon]|nr:hypothetical protein [Euryarchaeota archaeon]MDP6489407.1 HEAT repeat domain-containing protein [Candidatus Poseidoniia archaeon]MDP6533768.1 HEAT repeat domain-containing protein [Candidatus Poseidoniia archaeon]
MGIGEDIRTAHEASRIERQLKRITSATPDRRIMLVQSLRERFVPALVPKFLPQVTQLLTDDNSAVRHQAVLLLTYLFKQHPDDFGVAIGPLVGQIQDSRMENRRDSLKLLGKIAKQKPRTVQPHLAKLVNRLDDPTPGVQKPLTELLVDLGCRSPAAVTTQLIKLLDPRRPQVCRNGLEMLTAISAQKPKGLARAVPRLVKLLGSKDRQIQKSARKLLTTAGQAGVTSVPKLLLRALTGRKVNSELRLQSIRLAQQLAEHNPTPFVPAVKQLARDLEHRRWEIREQAALLLGTIGRNEMKLVREGIPALAQALNDDDDLVRTAAVRAMEKIKVSSLDYTELQKASEALESAKFVLRSVSNLGIEVEQADKFVGDAKRSYNRGQYQHCIDYAVRAEKMASRAEKESEKAGAALTRAENTLQNIDHKGVAVGEAEKLLAQAEKLLARHRYKEAREQAEEAVEVAQRQEDAARPDIVLRAQLEKQLQPDAWNNFPVQLENLGDAVARTITLGFSASFAVRGPTMLDTLEVGKTQVLALELHPNGQGLLPLGLDIEFHSLEGEYFHTHRQETLFVGEETEFEPRELFVSEVDAPVVPDKTVVTRQYYVECDNCGTRVPSDFRICGKCGKRLRERTDRSQGYHCLGCNSPLSLNQKFCGSCGNAAPAKPEAPTICSHCNAALNPEQKFCGGCGAPVILI